MISVCVLPQRIPIVCYINLISSFALHSPQGNHPRLRNTPIGLISDEILLGLYCKYNDSCQIFSHSAHHNAQKKQPHQVIAFFSVVLRGFEPRQAEPKTAVLPLHHKTILTDKTHRLICECKFTSKKRIVQIFRRLFCNYQVIIFLSSLCKYVFAIEKMLCAYHSVGIGKLLFVDRHAAALRELSHLSL